MKDQDQWVKHLQSKWRNIVLTDDSCVEVALSSKHVVTLRDPEIPDIDADEDFMKVFRLARPFSMTNKDAMYALYKGVEYICRAGVPGAFVECGVWKGGSALLAGLTMRNMGSRRPLYLYDTFSGMTEPGDLDVDIGGQRAATYIETYGDNGRWCYADIDSVRSTFLEHGFKRDEVNLIAGDVLETLKHDLPDQISILRLDTDWYESTRLELELLYPRLSPGGLLIIDDYGHWKGARKAVDEYFSRSPIFLHRVNYAVRLAMKI